MWASPLKEPKRKADKEEKEDEIKKFKKPKAVISRSCIKHITGVKSVDKLGCEWADRWVEQLIRERCLPPQILSADFESVLGKFLVIKDALEILEQFRNDYRRAFPLTCEVITEEIPEGLDWIVEVLRSDPAVIKYLPPHYLD